MAREQHRHDISDRAWEKIRPHTIGEKGTRGGNARDTRQFINGVFWILRTGAPWRDLPEAYGNWKNVHRRFCRWSDKGIWENVASVFTIAAYMHYKLTRKKVIGIGDASGMFPIDSDALDYNENMVQKFDALAAEHSYPLKLREVFPKVLVAGDNASWIACNDGEEPICGADE